MFDNYSHMYTNRKKIILLLKFLDNLSSSEIDKNNKAAEVLQKYSFKKSLQNLPVESQKFLILENKKRLLDISLDNYSKSVLIKDSNSSNSGSGISNSGSIDGSHSNGGSGSSDIINDNKKDQITKKFKT